MMFKVGSSLLFFLLTFISFVSLTCSSEMNFNNLKQKLIKETSAFKLQNYLRKIKMKNLGIINASNKSDFVFLDSDDKEKLILHNISMRSLNFEKMTGEDFDEFKARVFAYMYKTINDSNEYLPVGVNFDEEKHKDWKIYLVLMSESKNEAKHKLLKVCFRENLVRDNLAIVHSFDKPCGDVIAEIEEKGVFNDDHNESTRKLHFMQNKILEENLKQHLKIENSAKADENQNQNSFLEKSVTSSTKESTINSNDSKTFSLDTLADKFSVEDLAKIKSLIKFAKTNKILDDIYNRKGEVKLEDLFSGGNNIYTGSNSTLPIGEINAPALGNVTNVGQLHYEVAQLKWIIQNQNMRMENYFQQMSNQLNEMRESIVGGNVNKDSRSSKRKEIKKLIKKTKIKKSEESNKEEKTDPPVDRGINTNTLQNPIEKASPFLSSQMTDSIEEDDYLENSVMKRSKKLEKEDSSIDYINP